MSHDLRGQCRPSLDWGGVGGGAQPGGAHRGLGDLNGEKSNNCIRPEGGRAF